MFLLLMPIFPRLVPWVLAWGRPDARGWLHPQANIRPLGPGLSPGVCRALPQTAASPLQCPSPSPLLPGRPPEQNQLPVQFMAPAYTPFLAEAPSTVIRVCSVTPQYNTTERKPE